MELATYDSSLNNNEEIETTNSSNNHGWQKVTYAKRQRKPASDPNNVHYTSNGTIAGEKSNVFRSIETKSEDRRRRILEAQKIAAADHELMVKTKKHRSDDDDDDESGDENARGVENGVAEVKKAKKPKKEKKPKVTVAEAAAKIDDAHLAAFLADVTASYETQQDIQLMRFADYFGRAFSGVSGSQFPWTKMFRESTVAKIVDIPLLHVSQTVYKTSVDWINNFSAEALSSFVLWSLDSILTDLASHQSVAKGSKKGVQHVSSKSPVAIFIVLAMVIRRKPDILVGVLPALRANAKYHGQDKLPVIVWMVAQAAQGDLAVGLYCWAHNLLPIVSGKSNCNPQSRDLVLQLVERILASAKARVILVNAAVRKGERLIPPSAFELLVRVTFPASSARIKATERFEAIYPTLKEVALAGSPGSKAMKQVSQHILSFAVEAAGEKTPELSKEATSIFIWCLIQNADCYKQWDMIYEDKLEASAAVLRKLTHEWKNQYVKQFSPEYLKITLKSFRQKNEKALATGDDSVRKALLKEADKYCKVILGRLSSGHGCVKVALVVVAIAAGAAYMSPNMGNWDLEKLYELPTSFLNNFI